VGAAVSHPPRLQRLGWLLFLFWWSTAVPVVAAALPAAPTGTVTWVYDADTLEGTPHGKVRLLGIDAPEKAASERDQALIKLGVVRNRLRTVHGEGLAWTIRNVKGCQVALTFGHRERDHHGRLLAYVRLPDGRLLNRVLLEEGLAIVYRRFDFALKDDYLTAEAEARQRGAGLWKR